MKPTRKSARAYFVAACVLLGPPTVSAWQDKYAQAAKQAQTLEPTDPQKDMAALEAAIAAAPSDARAARLYLQLGKLKRAYEDYPQSREGEPGDAYLRRLAEFEEYAKARPHEYFHNEIGGNYLYNGFHFDEVVRRFPANPLAVEADYEKTKLSLGGECEGYVTCYISAGFMRVRTFLEKHPESAFSAEAVKRANEAFRSNLWGDGTWKSEFAEIKDPHKDVEGYEAAQLKRMVQEYEDLAPRLPKRLRASAYETVAYYRARFGETAQARKLYRLIVAEVPDYEGIADVRKALAALK